MIEPDVFGDDRGFFMESYNERSFSEMVAPVRFVQDNHSRSTRGVLRGLHLQTRMPQGKLVRVSSGAVWDVAVDVDHSSNTFGEWVGVELTSSNRLQLYIPPGYAHGFCVLSDSADFQYKCTDFYDPTSESGVIWSDSDLAIKWPIENPQVSEKDAQLGSLLALVEEISRG